MDTILQNVAGLDVHQKSIVACIRRTNDRGQASEEVGTFGTMTRDLLALADWMQSRGVTHVALESTGVLWKPVYNVLEGLFELLLVNPREIKQVPGRKSDVSDAQWIAHLLACGLLKSSFVPPRELRELRDLTRHRAQLVAETTRVANRIHKTLEDANIKLGAVASDILGKSGRAMLHSLIHGERDPAILADLAKRRLRKKIPQLQRALEGRLTEHHRYMLERLLRHLRFLEAEIEDFDARIAEALAPFLTQDEFRRLDEIPGLNRRSVENVIAEIGSDMNRFPGDDHLCSWAGMSPGNEESAGKRKRQRTTHGNRWLRRALSEAAWAASHTKDSYLSARYRRLSGRRGKKRALIAVGHTLLKIIYHVLKHGIAYRDLGVNYFDQLSRGRLERYLVKRLEGLGYRVSLTSDQSAA